VITTPITRSAPAKVNLTLDVFPPRTDGYHDLDSIVVPIAPPSDDVTVTVRPGARTVTLIVKHAPEGFPKGAENLAARAATAFLNCFAIEARVFIKLDKRLPLQAGLGGGSSDAAAVLLALQEATETGDRATLNEIAAQLGSDIPLFLRGGAPVRMRGRGEIVEALPAGLPPLHGVIVKPAVGVPTGPAYTRLDSLTSRTAGQATERLLAALRTGIPNAATLAPLLQNDFEAAVLPDYPEVAAAYRAVEEAGALRPLLCGSGASIFGLAESREHARSIVKELCGRFAWVKMASGIGPTEGSR